jgi:hypothetical protein
VAEARAEYRVVGVRRFSDFPTMPINWAGTASSDLLEIEALAEAARKRGNHVVRIETRSNPRTPWIDLVGETTKGGEGS